MSKDYQHVTVIAASADDVWTALTSAEFTRQYWHQTEVTSDWAEGSAVRFLTADGRVGCEGKVLKSERPLVLSYTWSFPLNPDAADEAPSRVTFTLKKLGEHTKLTVLHDHFPEASVVYPMVRDGWPMVIAGLKTLLETGKAVDFWQYEA